MEIIVNDIKLYYEKIGQGQPLIMVHGNGEDHHIFDEAVNLLKNHFTCYLIDSRGHGKSQAVSNIHYQDMANDVMAFIKELGLQDVYYYGFSDGGIIGLLIASQSDLLDKMIISGANLNPDGVKLWLKILFKIIYFFKRDPKIKLMLTEPNITTTTLNQIKIPVYVLAGSKDLVVASQTKTIAQEIKNSTLNIIANEGHGSYIIKSTKIANLIIDYLKESNPIGIELCE